MLIIHTIFDYKKPIPWPLATGIWDIEKKQFIYIDLYRTGPDTTLYTVQKRLETLKKILQIKEKEISVNDYMAHITSLHIPISPDYNVYSRPKMYPIPDSKNGCRKLILQEIKKVKNDGVQKWQKIDAKAQLAYSMIEKNGLSDGTKINKPKFDMHTFSGRSRSRGFNIHGLGNNNIVMPRSSIHNVFIQFDWIAADLRAASILAKDTVLQHFFDHSDPYERIAEEIGEDREYCKIMLLKSLYSLNYDAPEMRYYPKFQKWIENSVIKLKKNGYLESILGRKFYMADSQHTHEIKRERAVFNATVQGTIAHAMNASIAKVAQNFPSNLLLDQYDSLILTCSKSSAKIIINEVGKIMLRPFHNVLKEDPTFPVRVSVGPSWRNWKPIREFR